MKHLLLLLTLLLPLPAFALTLGNCDKEPHSGKVIYNGDEVDFTLAPGQRRYFSGIPVEIHVGKEERFDLRSRDFWCIWGKDEVHLQRRARRGLNRN